MVTSSTSGQFLPAVNPGSQDRELPKSGSICQAVTRSVNNVLGVVASVFGTLSDVISKCLEKRQQRLKKYERKENELNHQKEVIKRELREVLQAQQKYNHLGDLGLNEGEVIDLRSREDKLWLMLRCVSKKLRKIR